MKLSNRILLVGVSLMLALTIMACGKKEENTNTAPKGPDDTTITSGVKAKLTSDIPGSAINVATKDGVVTLSGDAKSPQDVTKAEQSAKTVTGVKSVVNNVKFMPSPDDELRKKVEENLTKHGVTGITVVVQNGEVTLRGDIPKAKLADARKAADEAQPKKVNNQMNVK